MAVPWLDALKPRGGKMGILRVYGILRGKESQGATRQNSNKLGAKALPKLNMGCLDPKTKQMEAQSLVDEHLNFVGKTGRESLE
jgi:hypothetical protein